MRTSTDILADPRITFMGLFAEAFDALSARLSAQIAAHQLNSAEFEALLRLSRSPDHKLRMSDLAAQAGLTNSGATRLVDRLEARGLIAREGNPLDRRGTKATLTEDGLSKILEVLPGHLEVLERSLIAPLSEDERSNFAQALRTLRDALRPDASSGA
jgi:MarR family 2-MHQ and catechol resistance regulon transcriptional repressor